MKSAFAIALTAAVVVAQKGDYAYANEDAAGMEAASVSASSTFVVPFWRRRYAYCKMQWNPAYPTTNPYGFFRLSEMWGGPLTISGWMRQLPAPSSAHGFSINWSRFVGDDCRSTEGHFNPTGEQHGPQDFSPSHVGDLWPIFDDGAGNAWYYTMAMRPTLFWGSNNVSNRSMVVYENPDDFGFGGNQQSWWDGNVGREIACCNIRPFRIRRWPYFSATKSDD